MVFFRVGIRSGAGGMKKGKRQKNEVKSEGLKEISVYTSIFSLHFNVVPSNFCLDPEGLFLPMSRRREGKAGSLGLGCEKMQEGKKARGREGEKEGSLPRFLKLPDQLLGRLSKVVEQHLGIIGKIMLRVAADKILVTNPGLFEIPQVVVVNESLQEHTLRRAPEAWEVPDDTVQCLNGSLRRFGMGLQFRHLEEVLGREGILRKLAGIGIIKLDQFEGLLLVESAAHRVHKGLLQFADLCRHPFLFTGTGCQTKDGQQYQTDSEYFHDKLV